MKFYWLHLPMLLLAFLAGRTLSLSLILLLFLLILLGCVYTHWNKGDVT